LAGLLGGFLRKFQSGFVHLPAPELLFSCVAKRKVTQREGHPGWRFPSIHGRKVRESVPGFSSGPPARAKRRAHPWARPLRGLIVPVSPPPRGPEEQARIVRARSQGIAELVTWAAYLSLTPF